MESRPIWRTRLIAIELIVGCGFTIIIAFQLMIFGVHLARLIENLLNLNIALSLIVAIFRWPVVFASIVAATMVIYRIAPNISLKWRHVAPGALFFTSLWMLITTLFSFYVETFGRYNITYGAIGGVIVLMTWMYLTALALLLGGELNSEVYKMLVIEKKDPK